MNGDKAYLLGLIIGGGIWGNAEEVFRVRLPYKQWGSYEQNPQRAGEISRDILKVVSPMFKNTYDINISYDTSKSGEWNILCEGDLTELTNELEGYGISCEGELRKNASIDQIVPELIDDNLKRRFIAGLADTIGSTKESHRRFNDNKQILSFEISGYKFDFVCGLCKLLHSIQCYPDQILWNHPNFHCPSNPYDTKWKKGFKLRVLADQYDLVGAYLFTSKALSAKANMKKEKVRNAAIPCEERTLIATPSSVHPGEQSALLPPDIRDGHYLHNKHVCAVMGCEHAPVLAVSRLISDAQNLVNPFPILTKGKKSDILNKIDNHPLYKNRNYTVVTMKICDLYQQYKEAPHALLFGTNDNNGYPINQIMLAVTYLIAAKTNQLKGSKPKGALDALVGNYLASYSDAIFEISVPDLLTPIMVSMQDHAALVGAKNPDVYKTLISISPDNPYKVLVRQITEDDLNDKKRA